MLGQELATSLKQCGNLLEDFKDEDEAEDSSRAKLVPYGHRLKEALQAVWDDHSVDVFNAGFVPLRRYCSPGSTDGVYCDIECRQRRCSALISSPRKLA